MPSTEPGRQGEIKLREAVDLPVHGEPLAGLSAIEEAFEAVCARAAATGRPARAPTRERVGGAKVNACRGIFL